MELDLTEKFLLLAQHPQKGRFTISDIHLNHGFAGSLLLEMSSVGKLSIDNDFLVLKGGERSDNAVIPHIEDLIKKSSKKRKMKHWISVIAGKSKKYKRILLESLAKKRLIRIEDKKFLGIIPYTKHYLVDNRLRNSLKNELRDYVLRNNRTGDQMILLSLVEACKMHKGIVKDRTELKRFKKELKVLVKESPIAGAVDQSIQEVLSAVTVAILASSIAATSAASSN